MTVSMTMADPSCQNLLTSYSRVTERLPATSRDILVAAGLFCSVVSVLLTVCGLFEMFSFGNCERDSKKCKEICTFIAFLGSSGGHTL